MAVIKSAVGDLSNSDAPKKNEHVAAKIERVSCEAITGRM